MNACEWRVLFGTLVCLLAPGLGVFCALEAFRRGRRLVSIYILILGWILCWLALSWVIHTAW